MTPTIFSAPRGLSFSIPEHMAVRSWAASNNLQVVTELDRVIGGEEYEEVLAFYDGGSIWRRMTLWRKDGAIVLEPSIGAARQFPHIKDAIDAARTLMTARSPRARRMRPYR